MALTAIRCLLLLLPYMCSSARVRILDSIHTLARNHKPACPAEVKKDPKHDGACMDSKHWTPVAAECCKTEAPCPKEARHDSKYDLCFDGDYQIIPDRCCKDTAAACPPVAIKDAKYNVCLGVFTSEVVPDRCCTVKPTDKTAACPASVTKHKILDVCVDDKSHWAPDHCCDITPPTGKCPAEVSKDTMYNVCRESNDWSRVPDSCCEIVIQPLPCPSDAHKDKKYDVCVDSELNRLQKDCCVKSCGAPPTIEHARVISSHSDKSAELSPSSKGEISSVKAGDSLLYWCEKGYTTDVESCDAATFEYNYDYNLPDEHNIKSTRQFNLVEGHAQPEWLNANGETYYWANVASPAECCQLCRTHPECRSFSYNSNPEWNNEGEGSGYRACYLKRGFQPGRKVSPTVISGYPIGSFAVTCNADGEYEWKAKCTKGESTGGMAMLAQLEDAVKLKGATLVSEVGAVLQLKVGVHRLHVDLKHGSGATKSEEDKADVVFTLSDSDFVAMFEGKLHSAEALSSGKLKVEGDKTLVQKLEPLLEHARKIWFEKTGF